MELQLTELLNLTDVEVEYYQNLGQELILYVELKGNYATCPRCGQVSHHLHQNHGYLVRDLPLSNRQVFLRVNRRQFKCKNCGKPFSEELDFVGKGQKYTHRYAQAITEQLIHSYLANVAKNNHLTERQVEAMINQVAKKILPLNLSSLKRLGIDEISLVKARENRTKKTAEELQAEEREKVFGSLKGAKYILLKREENLNKKQKEKLIKLKEASPQIAIMHDLKEEFTQIFDQSKNLGEGTIKLIDWLEKASPFFKKTVKTIKNWFGEIVGYFEQRTTQGVVDSKPKSFSQRAIAC